jgi:hypothetical protein
MRASDRLDRPEAMALSLPCRQFPIRGEEMPSRQEFKNIHKTIGHPKFGDALADLDELEKQGQLDQAKRDPSGWFKGKGIDIDPGVTIDIRDRQSPFYMAFRGFGVELVISW